MADISHANSPRKICGAFSIKGWAQHVAVEDLKIAGCAKDPDERAISGDLCGQYALPGNNMKNNFLEDEFGK